ncbi:hypothetical protein TNCV_2757291 [Trichonephila clavipes]|nr:hypothetical protein TNCV_2757291 [Trichonephila clavipes]
MRLFVGSSLGITKNQPCSETNAIDIICLGSKHSRGRGVEVSRIGAISQLPSKRVPRHALLAKNLVTWQAMVGRHILEDIVGRVAQNCSHTVTPCEIAVCRSTINAGSDPLAVRLQTRVRWSSSLRLNRGFITEDDTSPVCHTQVARGRQKSSRHCL